MLEHHSRTAPSDPLGPGPERERGVALILGVFFAIIISGLVFSGTLALKTTRSKTETTYRLHGQAMQLSRSGLSEALGWFRKQTSQPVLTFAPVRNTMAVPPILETEDPDIGTVREVEISGSIWGRYEVWKRWDADPDPIRLAWRNRVRTEDISLERGAASLGTVWRIRAIGIVFRRVDPGRPYNAAPNQVLARDLAETELRRLTLAPPGAAAICTSQPGTTVVNAKGKVAGVTGAGICHPQGGPGPTYPPGTVTGLPPVSALAGYDATQKSVFGVTEDELRSIADDIVYNPVDFPSPIPPGSVLFVDGNITFDAARPLRGNGIVYVRGNVTLAPSSNSWFTGFLYATGNVDMNAPCELAGSVVALGRAQVLGTMDVANVSYDDATLNTLRTEIGQYRISGAIRRLHAAE
jgi:hypothetical protein